MTDPMIHRGNVQRELSSFPEGEACFYYPSSLDAESVDDLEEWLLFVVNKLKRRALRGAMPLVLEVGDV